MVAYYNEWEPYPAQWLRNLIKAGLIADGDVDERSIVDVKAEDLKKYTQCHFFAGIGGWSIALRLALWADDRPVWTGSCPCQPFSLAGQKEGHGDERHLWPHWSRLIGECQPPTVFGEQVASAIAFGWADEVSHDLEAQGYAFAQAVLPACSVKAPHKRDRLWFVANSTSVQSGGIQQREVFRHADHALNGYTKHNGLPASEVSKSSGERGNDQPQGQDKTSKSEGSTLQCPHVANSFDIGCQRSGEKQIQGKPNRKRKLERGFEDFNNGWNLSSPKICGVDDGVFGRTPKLRAYGNAIVPQVAQAFIEAFMECQP